MDNPPLVPPQQPPHHVSVGKAIVKALGFGLLLAIPMTYIFTLGIGTVISYFRLSYHWGLGGIFVGLAIIIYAFIVNAIIMVLATFITLERSSRPYVHAILIGLLINVIAVAGGWGYNLYTHQGQLQQLAVDRNNDKYVDAKKLSDCAKLTEVNAWTICIKDKIIDTTTLATCKTQAARYGGSNSEAALTCQDRFIINTGAIAQCNDLPLVGSDPNSQRYCLLDTIEKSWEKNNRKTPASIVAGCSGMANAAEKQFCYVASLRQLSKGDAAAAAACQGINPAVWFGIVNNANNDLTNIQTICGITITAS